MKSPSELNRKYWDALTPVHEASRFYDVAGFLAGRSSLHSIEREAVGDVAGKSLLHLQCHFGVDTLSWARLGAEVVGVDFSGASIARARKLAREAGLAEQARFVERNVLDLLAEPVGQFDVVFTSYGTITWLADLEAWGRVVAESLRGEGLFFMVDTHPASCLFEADATGRLARRYDYFRQADPLQIGPEKDYAEPTYTTLPSEAWIWSLGDVFGALEAAGLRVHEFKEYPRTVYQQFPDMRTTTEGYWEMGRSALSLPLLFSLKASRKAWGMEKG